jgi:hypothetical protein
VTIDMDNPEIGRCNACGMTVHRLDAHVLVSGHVLHSDCSGAPQRELPDTPGAWASMASRGQMGLGAAQGEPVIHETPTTGWLTRLLGRVRRG